MSQSVLSSLFIVLLFAFSSASFMKQESLMPSVNIFAEIQNIEKDDFGKKLMDTIALQIQNQAPLQDVAKLLSDIKANLVQQQNDADKLQNNRRAECKQAIANYNARITKANKEIAEATDNIALLRKVIAQLKASIQNKKDQLAILAKREVQLDSDWSADVAAYKKRKVEHASVLNALDLIIPKLKSIPTGQQGQLLNKEKAQVLAELSKIGKSNPIAALVAVATSIDVKGLQSVIQKLQAIRDSIAASVADDKKNQQVARDNYKNMKLEISVVRANLQSGLKADEASLAENQGKLAREEQRLEDNTKELKNAQEGLKQKTAQCNAWEQQYQDDTKQRNNEISIVGQVQKIIATRLETTKEYLKSKVNKI